MSLPWFRTYREMKDDPKMGVLNDSEFRVFIESMCWACERETGGGMGVTIKDANWAFRRNVTEALQTLLNNKMLGQKPDGELFVTNWWKRQMSSDSSTERVRKFREKRAETLHETLPETPVTVPVTVCNGAEESRVDKSRTDNTVDGGAKKCSSIACSIYEQIDTRAGALFGRTSPATVYAEQSAISEISRRPDAINELAEIEVFHRKPENYFPQSLSKLLSAWQETLDRARTHDTRKKQNETHRTSAPDRNAGTYNSGPLSAAAKSKVR